MQLKHVVLPEPFGPMSPRISAAFTSNDTPFSAVKPPKRLVRRVTLSTAPDAGAPSGTPVREWPDRRAARPDQRAAQGDEAGSSTGALGVAMTLGQTCRNWPSTTWYTAAMARSFCPRIALPSPRNFTP